MTVDDEDSCSIYQLFTLCRATWRVSHDAWEADRTRDNYNAHAKSGTRDTQVGPRRRSARDLTWEQGSFEPVTAQLGFVDK